MQFDRDLHRPCGCRAFPASRFQGSSTEEPWTDDFLGLAPVTPARDASVDFEDRVVVHARCTTFPVGKPPAPPGAATH